MQFSIHSVLHLKHETSGRKKSSTLADWLEWIVNQMVIGGGGSGSGSGTGCSQYIYLNKGIFSRHEE